MIGAPELFVIVALLALLLAVFTIVFILADRNPIQRKLVWIAAAIIVPVVGPVCYFWKGRPPAGRDPGHP